MKYIAFICSVAEGPDPSAKNSGAPAEALVDEDNNLSANKPASSS